MDIRDLIAVINPILRGWGNYFRTGNAARKFVQIDRYVANGPGWLCARAGNRSVITVPWRSADSNAAGRSALPRIDPLTSGMPRRMNSPSSE